MAIRLLLVDDDAAVRAELRRLLAEWPEIEVVGEAESGPAAVRLATGLSPDLVLMDVVMAGGNGVDATSQVLLAHPGAKVLALSMHGDPAFVRAMRDAGASGYLLKDALDGLHGSISAVMAGRTCFPDR
jgi:DNA-binding NarL/FixJ family response regulator